MNRIFTPLAATTILLLMITLALGLSLDTQAIRDPAQPAARQWFTVHFLTGVGVSLAVVLVNSLVVTYFIGTSRWCREVSEAYHLDAAFVVRSNRLKRRTFPVALVNMLLIVGVLALGGAADPAGAIQAKAHLEARAAAGTSKSGPHIEAVAPGGLTWGQWHLLGALTSVAVIAFGFFIEWQNIAENHQVITEIMAEVKRIRTERGLETQ